MIWLSHHQAQALIVHARADAPREACGLLVGRTDSAGRAHVTEITPIANAAADPLITYYMDERALVTALSGLQARRLELLGFYHSHPSGDPIPSPTDVRHATYPDTPYLIVGLNGNKARLAAWKMRPGQVEKIPLHIGNELPDVNPSLTRSQQAAIILAALIAFALLIVVSLTLLPPAPAIPPP